MLYHVQGSNKVKSPLITRLITWGLLAQRFRKSAFSLGGLYQEHQRVITQSSRASPASKCLANRIWRICLVYWWILFSEVVVSLNAPGLCLHVQPQLPKAQIPCQDKSCTLLEPAFSNGDPDFGPWSPGQFVLSFLARFPLQTISTPSRESEAPKDRNCKSLCVPPSSRFPLQICPPSPQNLPLQLIREYWKEPTLIGQKQNNSNQK